MNDDETRQPRSPEDYATMIMQQLGANTMAEAATKVRELAGSVAFLGQMAVPVVAAINATNQSLYEDSADNHLYYKNSLGASYKLSS